MYVCRRMPPPAPAVFSRSPRFCPVRSPVYSQSGGDVELCRGVHAPRWQRFCASHAVQGDQGAEAAHGGDAGHMRCTRAQHPAAAGAAPPASPPPSHPYPPLTPWRRPCCAKAERAQRSALQSDALHAATSAEDVAQLREQVRVAGFGRGLAQCGVWRCNASVSGHPLRARAARRAPADACRYKISALLAYQTGI